VGTRFLILPITPAVTRIAVEFPSPYPLDPMGRIIGATALDRGVPLVTKDKMIRKAKPLSVIW
jgi:PIN domain nuclease of toxin-antitoxin system